MANGNNNDPTQEFLTVINSLAGPMGDLISTFLMDISAAEYKNRLHYAAFMQLVAAMKNVEWSISMGILTMEQALMLDASLPMVGFVPKHYTGVTKATEDITFRVSTQKQSEKELDENIKTHAGGKIGGFLGLFGGGSFSVDSDTTYKDRELRKTNCESTVDVHIEIGTMPPPETVAYLDQESAELVKGGIAINKIVLKKQEARLGDEADNAEVPKGPPKDDENDQEDGFFGPDASEEAA